VHMPELSHLSFRLPAFCKGLMELRDVNRSLHELGVWLSRVIMCDLCYEGVDVVASCQQPRELIWS